MKEERRPSMGLYFCPDTKLFHIVIKEKDVPGALAGILTALSGVVDLVESVSYSLGDGNAIWSGFGKGLSGGETEDSLKTLVKRSPLVLECEVKESDNGLIVDSFHAGVEVAPGRLGVILPASGFTRICGRLAGIFGSGGEAVLYEEGRVLGYSMGLYMNEKLGKTSLDFRLKAVLSASRAQGWGSASVVVDEPGARFHVKVEDCLECSENKGDRRECSFIRGCLVGIISTVAGREFTGGEARCRLRGDSSCEFILSRKS